MIWLVVGLLGAGPTQCGADLDCLVAAAKTCAPAVGVMPDSPLAARMERPMNFESTATNTYSIAPSKTEACLVTMKRVVTAVQMLDRAGKTEEQVSAFEQSMISTLNATPAANQECTMPKTTLARALRGLSKGDLNSEDWKDCHPLTCAPPPPAAKGCSWSECTSGLRTLVCLLGSRRIVSAPTAMSSSGGHCVASCRTRGAPPTVECSGP